MNLTAPVRGRHTSLPKTYVAAEVVFETEDVPSLLTKVADLIGLRAIRRIQRLVGQN